MSYTKRTCDNCKNEYQADNRNLNRGWGLCCSKRCAAKKREMSRPDYDVKIVAKNNHKRIFGNGIESTIDIHFDDMDGHFSNEDN